MSQLLTLYARKEPTADTVSQAHGCGHKKDTVFYRDPACSQFMARKPWYQSGQPNKRSRKVMLNCYHWNLVWAPSPA